MVHEKNLVLMPDIHALRNPTIQSNALRKRESIKFGLKIKNVRNLLQQELYITFSKIV